MLNTWSISTGCGVAFFRGIVDPAGKLAVSFPSAVLR
jgi:hypothetical protein